MWTSSVCRALDMRTHSHLLEQACNRLLVEKMSSRTLHGCFAFQATTAMCHTRRANLFNSQEWIGIDSPKTLSARIRRPRLWSRWSDSRAYNQRHYETRILGRQVPKPRPFPSTGIFGRLPGRGYSRTSRSLPKFRGRLRMRANPHLYA